MSFSIQDLYSREDSKLILDACLTLSIFTPLFTIYLLFTGNEFGLGSTKISLYNKNKYKGKDFYTVYNIS